MRGKHSAASHRWCECHPQPTIDFPYPDKQGSRPTPGMPYAHCSILPYETEKIAFVACPYALKSDNSCDFLWFCKSFYINQPYDDGLLSAYGKWAWAQVAECPVVKKLLQALLRLREPAIPVLHHYHAVSMPEWPCAQIRYRCTS